MSEMNKDDDPRLLPWYRHFWIWVIVGLPLTAIVAGVYTLLIAAQSPDALVVDDYYREGLAINRRLDREAAARARGVTASLQIDLEQGSLVLVPEKGFSRPLPDLVLSFIHPTLRGQDQEFVLRSEAGSGVYRADGIKIRRGLWHIRLRSADDDWQLDSTATLTRRQRLRLRADNDEAPAHPSP